MMRGSLGTLLTIGFATGLVWTASAGCNEEIAITPKRDIIAVVDDGNGDATTQQSLFISPSETEGLRRDGAVVLDARSESEYLSGHIPGAAHAPWERFVDGQLSGLLLSDIAAIQQSLREAGVRKNAPIVVYGGWKDAWGEEGRLFWMLEYLGVPEVSIMTGGIQRWTSAGFPIDAMPASSPMGDVVVKPIEDRRATVEEVLRATEDGKVVIIDTRDPAEYEGATPYGSERGGHIPNAKPFWWKDAFDASGNLRPKAELKAIFDGMGITNDTVVIAYCTGGVRSGFFYAVMRWLGYTNTQNYDGSWWEWAARADLPVSDATNPASQPGE